MKSKILKKVAAFVTATTMAMGTFALLPEEYLSEIYLTVSAVDITESGQCGDNVYWELDENGTLTISGTGNMYEESGQPFYDYRAKIKQVIIKSGVTSISNSLFYHLYELTNVTIPDTVTSIGNSAFYQCEIITSISIPNSVTSIGDHAFTNCFALKNINIPFGVTVIDDYAFSNCRSLSNITLPNSISKIGECSFYKCWELGNITIPDSVTSIGMGAFSDCENITDMIIPDSVNTMGDQVFESCSSLKSVKLSSKVSTISRQTFMSCSGLEKVIIPEGVTSIGEAAFIYCSKLKTVNLPSTLKTLDGWAFDSCSSIMEINIPDGVTSIGQSAFRLCTSLTKATIPASVTSIGNYAFIGDDSLTIYGYKSTVAETYANENEIPFVALDSSEEPAPGEDYTQYLKFEFNNGEIIKYNYENGKFNPTSKEIKYFYGATLIDTDENKYGNDVILSNITIKLIAPMGFSFDKSGNQTAFSKDFAQLRLNTEDCSGMVTLYPQKYTYPTITLKAEVYVDNVLYKTFETKVGVSVNNSNAIDISEEYDETDTDGDGLPDVWEMYGITYNGEFLDLPAMGADPNIPDVFVEIDYKSGIDLSEYENEFRMVYNQFKKNNINLHIDRGINSIDFVTGEKWGYNSRSNSISGNVSVSLSGDLFNPSNHFLNMDDMWKKLIKINFNDSPVRTVVFRYCILGDSIESNPSYAGYTVGQYFYIALESLNRDLLKTRDDYSKDGRLQYATVQCIMHELGHTLGLGHGGAKEKGRPNNYKRKREDYLSIMSYEYNYFGVYNYGTKYNRVWSEEGLTYSNEENDWGKLKYDIGKIGAYGGALDGYINSFMDIEFVGDHDENPLVSNPETNHIVNDKYCFDSQNHWKVCSECGEKIDISQHISNSGVVTIQPTATTTGVRVYSCSVCGCVLRTETIPATGSNYYPTYPSYPTYTAYPVISIPSVFNEKLSVKAEADESTVTLSWNEVKKAGKYYVYQYKDGKYVKVKTTTDTSVTFKKMKNGEIYKYLVRYTIGSILSPISYSGNVSVKVYYKPIPKPTAAKTDITLKWEVVPDAKKYAIYKYVNGKAVKLAEVKSTSVKISKLSPDTEYSYIVSAYVDGKWTIMTKSDIVTVKTKAE